MNGTRPNRGLVDRGKRVLAQGYPGTNSKRYDHFVNGVYPSHVSRGTGCYLFDMWGNRYIDFICALGPSILGYSHPAVNEAVISAVRNGGIFSLPSHLEVELAEELSDWLGIEKMRFFLNGDDATTAAIRIARCYTDSLTVGSDGYHGCSDTWTSLTPPHAGCPSMEDLWIEDLRDDSTIAILEPVQLDMSQDRRAYLSALKNHTIIYDEIVTGLRVPKGTIAKMWDLHPDIICLGKAFGNGYPISIVGGKKDVLDSGDYFLSRTFAAHPVSLAACQATIREVKKKGHGDLFYYAQRFQKNLNEACKEIGVEWEGYGTRCQMNEVPGIYLNGKALLMQECVKAGVLFGTAFYYGYQHLEARIDEQVLNIVSDAVHRIHTGEVRLEGELPKTSFKR